MVWFYTVQGTTLLGPSATTIGSAHQSVQAPSRVATVITAGIPGSGKSTLIRNLLQLRGGSTPQAAGFTPSSVTRTNEVYRGEIRGRNVQVIEVKLPVSDEKGLATELKSTTGGRVDVLLYCVSISPNTKVEGGDEKIIQALTMSFGRGVWDRAILVLTFANLVKMLSVQGKGNTCTVGKAMSRYGKGFQEKLRSTNRFLKNYTVVACTSPEQNASSERNRLHNIVAIPAGCEPKEVLISDTPWDESISTEILNKIK